MFSIENSLLLVIDVQGALAYKMHDKDSLFKNVKGLIQTAYHLQMPLIYTEQVPEKIGATVPEIKEWLTGKNPVTKATFSCCGEENFVKEIKASRRREIIVCGIEAHVCVYQTVADLLEKGYCVQVVVDAISSRTEPNNRIALNRMEKLGAGLTSTEMIITELLKTSKHKKFKEVLGLIK